MTRNILLLSERDFLALPIIRSLNPNEFRAYVLGPADSTVRFSRFCARYFSYPGDGTGTDYAESINATCQKFGIEAVIPLDLPTTVRLSDHRHRICVPTLPVADSATLLRLHDKWQFAKTLDRLGIPYPETVMVERRDSLVDGILPYPFMVKPLDLEAGRGIVKISDSADLRGYLDSAAWRETYPVLVQRYVHGTDVGMSILAVDGKIIGSSIQRWSDKKMLELFENRQIFGIGEKIVASERYSGFMHVDFQMESETGEFFVLECNPRTWSSMNASMLNGADFIGDAVKCALGLPITSRTVRTDPYYRLWTMIRFMFTNPFALVSASPICRKDLWASLSDPIPYLLLASRLMMEKIRGKARR